MASSPLEKYEIILAADPRSRVFVELARALVDNGNIARAIEICRQGLEHHPSSIQGRLIWAKALLLGGDTAGAMGQLEAAMAVEPSNPYAYNLAAELLVQQGMTAQAVPILEKAFALQPANEQVRRKLAEAKATSGELSARPLADPAAPAGTPTNRPTTDRMMRVALEQPPAEKEETLELNLPSFEISVTPATPAATATSKPVAPQPPRVTPTPGAVTAPAKPLSPPPITTPPPIRRPITNPRSALSMIPEKARSPTLPPMPRQAVPSATEVARIAHEYERELRMKLVDAPGPPPGFFRRHWLGLLSAALAVLVITGGSTTYFLVRRQNRSQEVRDYVESAKKGLARDTVGALREAARVLGEARALDPASKEAASLLTEVSALLASDHDDSEARQVAQQLVDSGKAGEGALSAGYLLATTPAERAAPAEAVVTSDSRPGTLLQTLGGEVMLVRGEVERGLKLLEAAARAAPPMLRALVDLGDFHRTQGDWEQALTYHLAALAALPTHPRAALGAAESKLALGRDLEAALRSLEAIEADPGSAPPAADRLRFELVLARLLAATGDRAAAIARLDRAAIKFGARAEAAATTAEIDLASGALDRAVREAEDAVRLAPKEVRHRILLARALAGRGQYREIIGATGNFDSREIHIWRGVAYYKLGEYAKAMGALERTRREGKMPAEAAVHYALIQFALGQEAQARSLLRTLTSLESPPTLAFVASGRMEESRGQFENAESQYRTAVARDPLDLEANCALGRLLLARDHAADALPYLEKAAHINPFHAEARVALAQAHLSGGNAQEARAELAAVLASEPRNAEALRTSVDAAIADQDPAGARRAANRALSTDPHNPRSWLAVARAALAQGDTKTTRYFAERAAKSGKGNTATEAERLLVEVKYRR